MLHPLTQAFLQGLRPWLFMLLCLRLVALVEPSPVLWSVHQLVAGVAVAAGMWAMQQRTALL
ncbi:hypothetical protein ABS71_07720 [bacterium SCN 62-11]|nr:MAG: hypothetical protein ABS71_07720 [bacterium SCN 62-11]